MTNNKTIEQWAEEYSKAQPPKPVCVLPIEHSNAYLAGAAKQKELLMPIIEEMKEALGTISNTIEMVPHDHLDSKFKIICEKTLESIEEKLKGLG